MANWARTGYVIEGDKDVLDKIEQACLHHDVKEGSSEDWEGNVLIALGINEWDSDYYMRGFIDECRRDGENELYIGAEEAYETTDFRRVLTEHFDVDIYFITEEPSCAVYLTNDAEGKYFFERYVVDSRIHDDWYYDYFTTKEAAFEYIKNISNGKVTNQEELDAFNQEGDNDYIWFNEFEIVE